MIIPATPVMVKKETYTFQVFKAPTDWGKPEYGVWAHESLVGPDQLLWKLAQGYRPYPVLVPYSDLPPVRVGTSML